VSALDFLSPIGAADAGVLARSPMEALAADAGARLQERDGWNVAVSYPAAAFGASVSWCDTSHLAKLQLQGGLDGSLPFGTAVRRDGAWWCRLTADRALVIGARPDVSDLPHDVVDVTSVFASLTIAGPLARECLARFCALDLRPSVTPVSALRPGSIARQPGTLICEAEDRFLVLFGWATAEYVWSVVADASSSLGGGPIGVDQLPEIDTHQPTPNT
jgi:glycine cleavage system aminomethyltransferase T